MAKKTTKPAAAIEPAGNTTETAAPDAPKAPRVKKPKVEVPKTEAQLAAEKALADANEAARKELIANSEGKLKAADEKIAQAVKMLAEAKAEKRAIQKALNIKGTFGGKKFNKYVFVQDFPEGKGAPQARQILEIVKAGGADGVDRDKIVETMKAVINTKMDRSRLLSYYASRMVDAGVMKGV